MKKQISIIAAILLVVGGAAFWWQKNQPLSSDAAEKKMYTIGVVRTPPTLDGIWNSFRAKMKELGYEEGKNVTYTITEIGGDYAETKKKVALLFDRHLDLIYPIGSLGVRAAKEITEERGIATPIVFGIAADPVRAKLVKDLKNSGNNLTGVVSANEIVSSKRLELFTEAVPGIKRIIFPWNDPITTGIETFRQTAKTLGVTLVEKHASSTAELDTFLATAAFQAGDALFRASDTISGSRANEIIHLALKKKIPSSGTSEFDAENGALISYGANYKKMGAQGAVLADKILAGGKAPSDLPIELPGEFDLIVNLKTAQTLGIEIDPAFLAKATRLIR